MKWILALALTGCASSKIAKSDDSRAPAQAQDFIACYNTITGKTFSFAECDLMVCVATDAKGRQFSGIRAHYGEGYGPCIRPREEGEINKELQCQFGPGTYLESRSKPVQAFSSQKCSEAKVEFRQCLNGTMLGSYPYPNCQ